MLNNFTNQYSLSKTLRFELKPVGETADYLEDFKSQHLKDFIVKDQKRADDYKIIKELIDDYHRDYIEQRLTNPVDPKTGELWINSEDFEEAYSYYQNFKADLRDKKKREQWEKTQTELRKKLVKAFTDKAQLFKKELITRDLPEYLKNKNLWEKYKETVENFNKFTTYFSGFHENRKNLYTDKDQPTAIAYRLVNENLPRFFNNCDQFKKVTEKYPDLVFEVDKDLLTESKASQIDDFFQPRYFINLFSQSGIDQYEELLGGKSEENRRKTQGLNEQINLYRQKLQQKIKDEAKAGNKSHKKIYDLSGFTHLYKQILSDRDGASFIPEAFKDDKQLLSSLGEYINSATKNPNGQTGLIKQLEQSLQTLGQSNHEKIYLKSAGITALSQAMFGAYGVITSAQYEYAEKELTTKKKREAYLKQKTYSLAELDAHLVDFIQSREEKDVLREQLNNLTDPQQPISSYLQQAISMTKDAVELDDSIAQVEKLLPLESLSKNRKAPSLDNSSDQGGEGFQQVQKIQKMLDGFMSLLQVVKLLHLVDGRKPIEMPDKDEGFYNGFSEAYEAYSDTTITLYNKTRNHLTKKLYSDDKIKINFDAPTLLNGWDANKEPDNASILFEKDGLYYLGIMHPKHKHLFNYTKGINDIGNDKKIKAKDDLYKKVTDTTKEGYKKIVYKLLPGANKMLPKVFFSNSRISYFSPSDEVVRIRNTASHTKDGNPQKGYKKAEFNLKDCHTMIDFFKASLKKHPEWKEFNFQFSPTSTYEDLSGFYREVEHQGYRMDFHHIKESYIDDCITKGKLFLFQIYNKDFSPYSKGKPNLHTLYWKGLFEPENLKDVVLKLNGEAEIFYRKHSIKRKDWIKHKAGDTLNNKNENNPKKTSKFDYDIIKDRRYTQDKFQFHVPITLNFKAQVVSRFNDEINKQLAKQKETCVIGIDRGERHLLYYTVINSKGEIIEQDTLNTISTDKNYKVDYQQKLHTKEKEREKARKSWSSVENIKELKAGYLSHVIHKLANLIIKHNAIVCLEDLNFGFKRGRFKVEKQVYQKFEKALIDKLNYLVFKENQASEAGGYLNAYQLTAPFESFEKLGKQSGILFYVRADYTSKIDPATGFINFLHPRYESLAKSKTFFENIESFSFNREKDYFEMVFDYKKMKPSQKLGSYQSKWTVCTFGDVRYQNRKNDKGVWESEVVNVTERLKTLFSDSEIEYLQGQDLKEALILKKDTKFYKELFWLLKLTFSLRHSKSGTEEDFILSPVADENGVFFDSRNATDTQPKDADANGAYNIALKGLWNLQKIQAHNWDIEKPKYLDLAMKNEEWFGFVQNKEYQK